MTERSERSGEKSVFGRRPWAGITSKFLRGLFGSRFDQSLAWISFPPFRPEITYFEEGVFPTPLPWLREPASEWLRTAALGRPGGRRAAAPPEHFQNMKIFKILDSNLVFFYGY